MKVVLSCGVAKMLKAQRASLASLIGLLAACLISGCNTTLPMLGDVGFTLGDEPSAPKAQNIEPSKAEVELGTQLHMQIVEAFGGEYEDARVQSYVGAVGARLAAHTRTRFAYRFTVLNSPAVNALTLPGGRIYVTRGLLALLNTEAELASLLAHELGHANSPDPVRRLGGAAAGRNIGRTLPRALDGLPSDILALGTAASKDAATLAIAPHSTSEEQNADRLALEYMRAAGYSARGMARALLAVQAHARLVAPVTGQRHIATTHPRNAGQITGWLSNEPSADELAKPVGDYLEQIDGLVYGDKSDGGSIRGRRYSNPALGISYHAPAGYTLRTWRGRVLGTHANGDSLVFDYAPTGEISDLKQYLVEQWGRGANLTKIARIDVNGAKAVTAASVIRAVGGNIRARWVVVEHARGQVVRMLYLARPKDLQAWSELATVATYSLKRIEANSGNGSSKSRLRIEPAGGRSVDELAQSFPFGPSNARWFRMLNGLAPTASLAPDKRVKVVSN